MQSAVGGRSQLVVVQAENEALQQLVLDVADNKQAAQEQVARLRQKFANLVAQVSCHACHMLSDPRLRVHPSSCAGHSMRKCWLREQHATVMVQVSCRVPQKQFLIEALQSQPVPFLLSLRSTSW